MVGQSGEGTDLELVWLSVQRACACGRDRVGGEPVAIGHGGRLHELRGDGGQLAGCGDIWRAGGVGIGSGVIRGRGNIELGGDERDIERERACVDARRRPRTEQVGGACGEGCADVVGSRETLGVLRD